MKLELGKALGSTTTPIDLKVGEGFQFNATKDIMVRVEDDIYLLFVKGHERPLIRHKKYVTAGGWSSGVKLPSGTELTLTLD